MILSEEVVSLIGTEYRQHDTMELQEFLNAVGAKGWGPRVKIRVTEEGFLIAKKPEALKIFDPPGKPSEEAGTPE